MEWNKFDELDREYPEAIIEKRIKGFENATEGLASLGVFKLSEVRALSSNVPGDFKFDLILYSNILKKYNFKILTIGYGITLSPIYFSLEDSIAQELYADVPLYFLESTRKVETSEELDELLLKIFDTKSFNLVVRGLIKISKKEV